jgi:enterochelin esterase-like enzyme
MISKHFIHAAVAASFLVASVFHAPAQPAAATNASAGTLPPLSVDFPLPPLSDNYPLPPDALPQPGVPKGKVFKFHLTDSKVYPGTDRTIAVYIPAEYQGDKPACLMVFFGGIGPSDVGPPVFDNLIFKHEMPVTIAIGIGAGAVPSALGNKPDVDDPRYERSLECDSMTGRLARFVLEDVLPEVKTHTTPDGKPILISDNPDDRGTGGNSTGAIAAFGLAWNRPDSFHRVSTTIGTFVDCRGGERYYILVRKTEPKPLKIFMEDGVNDQCTPVTEMGDWSMSNQTMERALAYNGYDVHHIWGAGGHSNKHGAAVFPDAMRWLWKDWPAPIVAGSSGNPILKGDNWSKPIILPGETWQVAADGCTAANYLVADPQGKVYFQDSGKTFQISDDGKAEPSSQNGDVLAFGPDGKTYGAGVMPGAAVRGMTVRSNGDVYCTTETAPGVGELWVVRANGTRTRLAGDIKGPSGLAFTPNGLWLFVAQSGSRWGLSYRVGANGTVDLPEPFYDFWVSDAADSSEAGDLCMDTFGHPYAATPMGVQVFDRNGPRHSPSARWRNRDQRLLRRPGLRHALRFRRRQNL